MGTGLVKGFSQYGDDFIVCAQKRLPGQSWLFRDGECINLCVLGSLARGIFPLSPFYGVDDCDMIV